MRLSYSSPRPTNQACSKRVRAVAPHSLCIITKHSHSERRHPSWPGKLGSFDCNAQHKTPVICDRNCAYLSLSLSLSTPTNPAAHYFQRTLSHLLPRFRQTRRAIPVARAAWAESAVIRVESRSLIWSHSAIHIHHTFRRDGRQERQEARGSRAAGMVSEDLEWKPRCRGRKAPPLPPSLRLGTRPRRISLPSSL